MGTLFSTLDIGRSGLMASQIQLDVAGHNIANVNKEGYSRQRTTLVSRAAQERPYGQLGRGVQVEDIARVREAFLDKVYRQQVPGYNEAGTRESYFSRVQDLFQEPGENGFSKGLNDFFNSLQDFANNVEEQPVRMSAIVQAQSLSSSFNQVADQISALRTNANEEVRNAVPQINSLASRVAALNVNIRDAELNGTTANDLRDQRDLLLDQLAEQVNISYSERPNGEVDVLISGDTLVSGETSRELAAVRDPTLDANRKDLVQIRFSDNDKAVNISNGKVFGAMTARDSDLPQVASRIDLIASTIIQQINHINNTGNGLENLSGTISGSNRVTDSAAPLASAGLPFPVQTGSFDVIVYDSAGTPATTTINITAATTLDSLAADLSAIPNFSASVTSDKTLSLGAATPQTFSFANDTSGVLTALGVNGLFTGHDASTMAVNNDIANNPRLLTSGYSTDVQNTGDNTAALDLANVRNQMVLDGNSATINDYYESTIVRIGVDASANTQSLDTQKAFIDDFQARRQQVSGVSIDEEVTFMMQYQKGFEASARVITVTDSMLTTLMAMAT